MDQETTEKNASQMPISFLFLQRGLEKDNGHSVVLVLRTKWYSISEDSPQGEWDNMAKRMLLEFAESGHPIFRATSPLSRGRLKNKGHGKLLIDYCAGLETIETIFRILFLQISSAFSEQSRKFVKNTKLFTIERGNPLWEGRRVPHSCQA